MRRWTRQIILISALAIGVSNSAVATTLGDPASSSTSYRVVEGEVGGNGQFNSSSGGYSINPNIDDGGSSLGSSAIGNSASANYQSKAGFNTTAQPSLTFIVNTSNVNLGILTAAAKSTGTATFSVKDYTSYGYVVQIIGATPTSRGRALTALTTDTASSAGTEQFGVNTVLNTSAGVGADPVQFPSAGFSYGVAGDGVSGTFGTTRPYTITDKWRYASGETVASGAKSSGETDYTMTFLANISALTPSGTYVGNISLVATGTY